MKTTPTPLYSARPCKEWSSHPGANYQPPSIRLYHHRQNNDSGRPRRQCLPEISEMSVMASSICSFHRPLAGGGRGRGANSAARPAFEAYGAVGAAPRRAASGFGGVRGVGRGAARPVRPAACPPAHAAGPGAGVAVGLLYPCQLTRHSNFMEVHN